MITLSFITCENKIIWEGKQCVLYFTGSMFLIVNKSEGAQQWGTEQPWMTFSLSAEKGTLWLSACGWTTRRMTSTWGKLLILICILHSCIHLPGKMSDWQHVGMKMTGVGFKRQIEGGPESFQELRCRASVTMISVQHSFTELHAQNMSDPVQIFWFIKIFSSHMGPK